MLVLAKPVHQAFVVRGNKWDAFLSHKIDSTVLSRCDLICKLIKESEATIKNRGTTEIYPPPLCL